MLLAVHKKRPGLLDISLVSLASLTAILLFNMYLISSSVDWLALTLIAGHLILIIVPLLEMHRRGIFDLFHPLMWASISYVIPYVIIKAIALVLFDFQSGFFQFLGSQQPFLNQALLYMLLGNTALWIGYYLPIGKRASRRLPRIKVEIHERRIFLWGLRFLLLGVAFTLYLSSTGQYGYGLSEVTKFLGLLQTLAKLESIGLFMMFWAFTRIRTRPPSILLTAVIAIGIFLVVRMLSGGRSSLYSVALLLIGAYMYAKYPHVRLRSMLPKLLLLILTIVLGFIFFTNYRALRTEYAALDNKVGIGEQMGLWRSVGSGLFGSDVNRSTGEWVEQIITRFDVLDSLALILARADELKPQEQAVGIDNNILKEMFWTWVPRFVYPDKPVISDLNLWINRLYRDSPSMSWMGQSAIGDLYRNGRTVAVIFGMILLGIYLRVLKEWLVRGGKLSIAEALLYYFLLMEITLPTNYTPFLTGGMRTCFILVIPLAVIRALSGSRHKHRAKHNTLVMNQ
ncbi:MAG: hypothetical protein WCC06_03950 [Candidatus Aminicenantales bacterium]